MKRKLVPFNGKQFLEVDKVALKRTANALMETIDFNIVGDPYEVESKLKPVLSMAIRNEISIPYSENTDLIGGKYLYDYREGTLPEAISREFQKAFANFAVVALSMPLDILKLEKVNGIQMAWFEFEEEGDWPAKVKHP